MQNVSNLYLCKYSFRSDLAYIVRRRGYKRIEELLGITKETDLDGSNVEKVVSEDKVNKVTCTSIFTHTHTNSLVHSL